MKLLIIIALVFCMGLVIYSQFLVKRRFNKYLEIESRNGMTGAEVARHLLDQNGCSDVNIELTEGFLSDHYDPTTRTVRLSEDVYYGSSIAAISVASHECGHSIQHANGEKILAFRHHLVPVVNFTSNFAPFLLLAGILFKVSGLLLVGIVFFSFAVLFQLVTLPVEFDASRKARKLMMKNKWLLPEESRGVKKVLSAAALTYVAAALYSVTDLANLVFMFLNSQEEEE